MKRKLPIISTIVVLIAVGIMIRLGFWQLGRMEEKEALLSRFAASQAMSAELPWPKDSAARDAALYRRSSLACTKVEAITPKAGHNAKGETGWAHVAQCVLADGSKARAVLGWSLSPKAAVWQGGVVTGFIGPGGADGPRLVADPPLAGLAANAPPDPASIPNNHLSYAVQWFLFAAVALVIYALAVRKRLRG